MGKAPACKKDANSSSVSSMRVAAKLASSFELLDGFHAQDDARHPWLLSQPSQGNRLQRSGVCPPAPGWTQALQWKQVYPQYLPAMQEKARPLDVGKVMALVRGG